MAESSIHQVVRHIRRLVGMTAMPCAEDRELLERFLNRQDEAAFATLIRRHGPMVLGVCRRVLGQAQDAEDAFQAVFLVLIRKAGSLSKRELLAGWLYGVAHRTALKALWCCWSGKPARSSSRTGRTA